MTARRLRRWHLVAGTVVLAIVAAGSLFVGVSDLTLSGLLAGRPADTRVLVESRLPRLIAVLLAAPR
ncbi:hypothetical protein [Nonomuraea aridisoli]|uniref:hypothetical protein n=1 Tax=Nonomuraea aridisoli TaxID=2070368 RepID=UPI001F15E1B9|nr:hypothetical protein [Nonomuraea aridisoli]